MPRLSGGDAAFDACLSSIYGRVLARLSESSGNPALDLARSNENLAAMYQFDAPAFLIQKAHHVQSTRLRQLRKRSREEVQPLRLIQGGKA
jgi:hypothetical protein